MNPTNTQCETVDNGIEATELVNLLDVPEVDLDADKPRNDEKNDIEELEGQKVRRCHLSVNCL